jgi:hypothetical protein
MALDKLGIINQALIKVGSTKLSTLTGTDPKTAIALQVYDSGRNEMY